jgi:hypothetical protein
MLAGTKSIAMLLAVLLGWATPSAARRASCERRCGYRIAQCVLAHGGVDGAEQAPCRRDAVAACRRRGPRACPIPTHDEFAATLAAVQAADAAVHAYPLCAALLPDVPAATIEEAIAIGRDAAAALAQTSDPTFAASGSGHRGGAFVKGFIQGTSGHGAAFLPLGNVIVATARPSRAVTYQQQDFGAVVFGVVGVADGRAVGVLLTYCRS